MNIMKRNKKAVSPVVATAILVLIVIILAIIILLWARGFVKEVVEKDIAGTTKRIEQYCAEVSLRAILNDDGSFGFQNIGSVSIYRYKLKLKEPGSSYIREVPAGNKGTVSPGFSSVIEASEEKAHTEFEGISVIPILLGKSKKSGGIKEFECPETYAFDIK
jgi:flagellin-like protein